MFTAKFSNVKAVIDRTVNPDGRVPRMSEYKNRRVTVVILEDFTYPEKTKQLELGEDYKINPPTEELVVLTNEEVAKAFGNQVNNNG